ncbi:MAG: ATP-binding protein [Opitutales bacterium]
MPTLTDAAFFCAPAALLITDGEGRIRLGNEACQRLLGAFRKGETIACRLEDPRPDTWMQSLSDQGKPETVRLRLADGRAMPVIIQIRSISDGKEAAFLCTLEPRPPAATQPGLPSPTIPVDPLAAPVDTIVPGAGQDRLPDGPSLRNARKLEEVQQRFETFMDHFPGYAFLKDESLKHLWANRQTLNDLGLTLEEFVGTTVFDLFEDEFAVPVHERELRVLETGQPEEHLYPIHARNGDYRWEQDVRFRIEGSDGRRFLGGITVDVTDLQASKLRAESANTARLQFLSSLSHELRTPLNPILGFSELMRDKVRDQELKCYAENIQLAAEDLLALISDILDFTTLDLGELKITREPVRRTDLLANLRRIIEPKAEGKNLAFRIIEEPGLPDHLVTDDMRLRQILLNLLVNAVKYTTSGSVTLALRRHGHYLAFDVRDTGPGIPKDQQETIFQHFHQLESNSRANSSGVGLGLGIARLLTGLLGGELTVQSEPGKGSTFTLIHPLKE